MTELPIEAYRQEIVDAVENNRAVVIVGETGSGKTTQVPQFLFAARDVSRRIAVVEPRRIAAIATAEYVAKQLGCPVGDTVGFQIRFNDRTTSKTGITFMTDGILLQKAKSDPLFKEYDILVLDEVHERGINSDFVLGLAKRALEQRPDLKVVVMSATLEEEKFAEFLAAPVIHVEGRMYPVQVRFLEPQDQQDALALLRARPDRAIEALAAYTVDAIHRSGEEGDVLIFMPGQSEIHETIRLIEQLGHRNLVVFGVHGNMNQQEQHRIFEQVGHGQRKVVVATNIAETGITVPGVVHVVDSGLIKETDYDPATGIESLRVVEHSKAGLAQRQGRAGRVQPGVCWRLFERTQHEEVRPLYRRGWEERSRPDYTQPEIQRSDLTAVVLRLIGIGVRDIESFDYIDAPAADKLASALLVLEAMGAITNDRALTEVGSKLLDLPVDPKIGRMILAAEQFGCVEEVLGVAAALSVRPFFTRPRDKEEEADAAKRQFEDRRSDLLTALAVLAAYEENGRNRNWAYDNFLNGKALDEALAVRSQLRELVGKLDITLTRVGYRLPGNQFNMSEEERKQGETIGKAVTAGLIQNLAVSVRSHAYQRIGVRGEPVYIHPGSALFHSAPRLIVSAAVVKTTKAFARNCQAVELGWIEEVAPHLLKRERRSRPGIFDRPDETYECLTLGGVVIQERRVSGSAPDVRSAPPSGERLTARQAVPEEEVQSRLRDIRSAVEEICKNPVLFGYEGSMRSRHISTLTLRLVALTAAVREGRSDQARRFKDDLQGLIDAAHGFRKQREQRFAKRQVRQTQADQGQARLQEAETHWVEYMKRLDELKRQYGAFPGFDVYEFPIGDDGLPQDYIGKDDGLRYRFDDQNFEVLPEKRTPCWGYVTQWGMTPREPTSVALLMEVVLRPAHLQESESATRT